MPALGIGKPGTRGVLAETRPRKEETFAGQLANACLIAAAPDLLEALESVLRLTKVQQVLESWELGTLNAVVAKAKGRSL